MDLNLLNFGCISKAEVNALIGGGREAATAEHVLALAETIRRIAMGESVSTLYVD